MNQLNFREIAQAAEQLSTDERAALIELLQATLPVQAQVTREQLLRELESLRAAGAFENVESLYGVLATDMPPLSEEELNEYLHKIGS